MLTVIQENNHAHGNGHFTRNKTVLKSHHRQARQGAYRRWHRWCWLPAFPGSDRLNWRVSLGSAVELKPTGNSPRQNCVLAVPSMDHDTYFSVSDIGSSSISPSYVSHMSYSFHIYLKRSLTKNLQIHIILRFFFHVKNEVLPIPRLKPEITGGTPSWPKKVTHPLTQRAHGAQIAHCFKGWCFGSLGIDDTYAFF